MTPDAITNMAEFFGGSRADGPLLGFQDGHVDNAPRCQQERACVFENGHPGKHGMFPKDALVDRIVAYGAVIQEVARQQMEAIVEIKRLLADLQAENEALMKRIAERKL